MPLLPRSVPLSRPPVPHESLAGQTDDVELAGRFRAVAEALSGAEETINRELTECQGEAMDIGGYYRPDAARAEKAMRPSWTFNEIIDGVTAASQT